MNLNRNEKIAAVAMAVCAVIAVVILVVTFVCVGESARLPYYVCLLFLVLAILLCIADIIHCRRVTRLLNSPVALRMKFGPKPAEEIAKSGKTKMRRA